MHTLLLLHGALGSADQFKALARQLAPYYQVHTLNFSGHGGKPFARDFSIEQFADELVDMASKLPAFNHPVSVFGYSMGGYVAVYAALQYPQLFSSIVTLATKWHWDPVIASREQALLNADTMETKVPAFAKLLAERHAPNDWKQLLQYTSDMLQRMGQRPPIDVIRPPALSNPTMFLVGDRDKTVSVTETLSMHQAWPDTSFGVLPDTAHPFEKVDCNLLATLIRRFLQAAK